VTGSGHSPSTMTCTSSWLVNLDGFNRITSLDAETGVVVMQSGIRLYDLCEALDRHGLAMPNLGSINDQSIAGAIATGTHGSSMRHGLMSENILALRVTVADGSTRECSPDRDPDLFRAALLSLGALGIVTEVTFRAVPAFSLAWQQRIDADAHVLDRWDRDLWTAGDFVRVWWLPHTRRAVIWSASESREPHFDPPVSYYDGAVGYHVYHNLLYLSTLLPAITPWVEWFVYGMQFGFANGGVVRGRQPSRRALLLNCLYSQWVNEWALPLRRGPEALRRLSTWINHLGPDDPGYQAHGIPFSNAGIYAHSPVEVRVTNTSPTNPVSASQPNARPFLDPTADDGGLTLYLNATFYRPYHVDPPSQARFYEAFEWLMRDLGGRPHWAKNFTTGPAELDRMYGPNLGQWRKVRDAVDPDGMFVGPWHRRTVLGDGPLLPLEEVELSREPASRGPTLLRGTVKPGPS
jgi:D-arabinono-1,4-lactone oxidase